MRPSILVVLLLPALVVAGALLYSGLDIVRRIRHRQPLRRSSILIFLAGLLLIDGVASVVVFVDSALGHSEALKAAAPGKCLALFVVLVATPALALFFASRRLRTSNRPTSPAPPPDKPRPLE